MAKKKRKKKKISLTELRRRKLMRAVKRGAKKGEYTMETAQLVQIASPQKIRSLSANKNKKLHELSLKKNPDKAAEKTIKELRKQLERLEREEKKKREKEEREKEQEKEKANTTDYGWTGPVEEEEDEQEDIDEENPFTPDLGEIYYDNLIDSLRINYPGYVDEFKNDIDALCAEFGRNDVMAAIAKQPDDFYRLVEAIMRYELYGDDQEPDEPPIDLLRGWFTRLMSNE